MRKMIVGLLVIISPLSHAQICNAHITPTAPDSRYELVNNGTEVKDTQTDLIWQRCSLGQTWSGTACTGTAMTYNWINALQTAKNIGGDWRVPNIKELGSLVEKSCYSPSMNETIFPSIAIFNYWSSSPAAGRGNLYAWSLSSSSGGSSCDPKQAGRSVRLVRSGQ